MLPTLGENNSTQPLSEVSFKFASYFHFPRCRYATYFACSFHLIELRQAILALCRKPSFLENNGTTKLLMTLHSHFSTKKIFSLGILSERILFQNSKCQTRKKVSCSPRWYSPIKEWFLHSTLELGMSLRRSYFFRSKIG